MLINLKGGKGKKNRTTILSRQSLKILREYYRSYKPTIWLFESVKARKQYSAKSVQNVMKHSCLAQTHGRMFECIKSCRHFDTSSAAAGSYSV